MKFVHLFLLSILCNINLIAQNNYASDAELHARFDFTANRKIDLNLDINDIDRVLQTDKFVFFLMKDGPDNTVPFSSEWDKLFIFAGEFFERYLEIPYTIPICVSLQDLDIGKGGEASTVPISWILEGIGYSSLRIAELGASEYVTHLPEEGTSSIKYTNDGRGYSSIIGTIIHEMTHIIGINDEVLSNDFCYTRNEPYLWGTSTIYYIDTPQMRQSNGGYPVQFITGTGGHFVFPFALIDYDCNISPIGAMGSPTTFNPDGLIYYHLGDVTLALLESIGWKLKPGIDYTHNAYTGVLFEDNSSFDIYWSSLDSKMYYGEYYDKTPYTYQDWLDGNVSYERWESDWKKRISEINWIAFLDTAAYWKDTNLCDICNNLISDRDNVAYENFMNYLTSYISNRDSVYSMNEITLQTLQEKYPFSQLITALQQIFDKNLLTWEDFIYSQDWVGMGYGEQEFIDRFLEDSSELHYSHLIRRYAMAIVDRYSMHDYIDITETYLRNKYPLEELLRLLKGSTTSIEQSAPDTDIKIYCKNGSIIIDGMETYLPVKVYSITGKLIYTSKINSTVDMPIYVGKGIFIVVVGKQSFKVLVH